jgi:hypothetical protein
MKSLLYIFLSALIIYSAGCSDDDDPVAPEDKSPETGKVVNVKDIDANTSGKIYFRLIDSTVVTGADTLSNKWDVAFSRTTIYTNSGSSGSGNGGAIILKNTNWEDVKTAPEGGYNVDSETSPAIPAGSGNGWYLYNPETHLISAAAGVVFVIKTGDGKYAKLQIMSYYKGAPQNPDAMTDQSGFYSFKYFYQPDGSRDLE